MEAIKTFDVDGASVRIVMDKDPENPRDWDNLGTLALYHRRYSLGDKHKPPMEEAKLIEKDKDYICLKVYGYDHGGLVFQTTPYSCPWDSGEAGIIYVDKQTVRKEYGWKVITQKRRQHIERILDGEVETYSNYVSGQVYGYIIDIDGQEKSCYGFYELEHCIEEATANAKYMVHNLKTQTA